MPTCGTKILGGSIATHCGKQPRDFCGRSARRHSSLRLRLGRRLTRGKTALQIPPAQRAPCRHRVNDPAKRHTLGIRAGSHITLHNARLIRRFTLARRMRAIERSFPLPSIDFFSGSAPTFFGSVSRGKCCTIRPNRT
jgi:hypothetical protein